MKTADEIANGFAKKNGFNVIERVAEKDGWVYFHLNWKPRPKYTGNPNVIKISRSGRLIYINNLKEIFWALEQAREA
ncbi:MAG: hypothetical protein IJK78_11800 [Bacteroidales bacterium]|nr:hypothetical protein [Bacteroidales bacterium]